MIPVRTQYSGNSYRLFNDYNDVHVFVEDAGFENLYKEIFRYNGIKIRKVFSKNGKTSVIEAARSCKDRRCVYLVDRDWDDVLKISNAHRNLIVLEKYSIENYLIDHSGFYAIVLADNPKSDIETLLSSQAFDSLVRDVSISLRPLFECFLAMQVVNDGRTGCAQKPGSFQERNKTCKPDKNLIAEFITDIGIAIPQSVRDYFAGDVLRDRGHGKYMLHFVWAGVRQSTGAGQLRMETLMVRLAQSSSPSVFKLLCKEVMKRGTMQPVRKTKSTR